MGIGSSRGDDRAVAAAEMAISSPLLEASIDGAHGVLLSIQGGSDLGLFEINEAAQLVSNSAAVDANIIFGAVIDDALGDEVRVTVIAAGFDDHRGAQPLTSTSGVGGSSSLPSFLTETSSASVTSGAVASAPAGAGYAGYAGYAVDADTQVSLDGDGSGTAPSAAGQPDGAAASGDVPVGEAAGAADGHALEPDLPASGDAQAAGAPDAPAPAAAPATDKHFEVTTPRRRPVVFEEDDDLDVPDFLK
jgi:cell division protein FtsZ